MRRRAHRRVAAVAVVAMASAAMVLASAAATAPVVVAAALLGMAMAERKMSSLGSGTRCTAMRHSCECTTSCSLRWSHRPHLHRGPKCTWAVVRAQARVPVEVLVLVVAEGMALEAAGAAVLAQACVVVVKVQAPKVEAAMGQAPKAPARADSEVPSRTSILCSGTKSSGSRPSYGCTSPCTRRLHYPPLVRAQHRRSDPSRARGHRQAS